MNREETIKKLNDLGIEFKEEATDEELLALLDNNTKGLPQTLDELNKMLQSETDKRVTQALKTQKEKLLEEVKDTIKKERDEAKRLAKLTEEEKNRELLNKREAELKAREEELLLKSVKLEAVNIMNDKKIPVSLVNFVATGNAEETLKNIDVLDKAFKEAVELAVVERLKGKTPKGSSNSGQINPFATETFNLTKQGELFKENPELARQLKAQAGK